MAKSIRKVLVVLGTLALVIALSGVMTGTSSAANLTGGNYTYVLNGDEVSFQFDPVVRKDGLLLPTDVFGRLDINVDGTLGTEITLTKGSDVQATVTLGSTTATLNGKPYAVSTAPLRLSGRVFLPADILNVFGVNVTQDGNFVILRNYAEGVAPAKTYSASDWQTLKSGKWISANLKGDTSIFMIGDFGYLTPDMINSTNLGLDYGTRTRLLSMLQNNTLIYAKFSNTSAKSGAVAMDSLYLISPEGYQYDNPTVVDIGQGLVSAKLAPGATRIGILAYPKVLSTGTFLNLFYDPNNGNLGVFGNIK